MAATKAVPSGWRWAGWKAVAMAGTLADDWAAMWGLPKADLLVEHWAVLRVV